MYTGFFVSNLTDSLNEIQYNDQGSSPKFP